MPTYSKTKFLLRAVTKDVPSTVRPFFRQKLILSKSKRYLSTELKLWLVSLATVEEDLLSKLGNNWCVVRGLFKEPRVYINPGLDRFFCN